jgi:methionine-gamma-lyase
LNKDLKTVKLGTRALLAAHDLDFSQVRPHVAPIYQTTNFEYSDVEEGLAVFRHDKPGYIYTRYRNPNPDLFGHMVCELEEGQGAVTTASGMAALSCTMLAFLKPGDHIVASSAIYGGSRSFMRDQLGALHIETTFVDISDLDAVQKAFQPNTKVLITEVLANPILTVADIPALAELARQRQALFIVDNTFTPPPIFQPLRHGAHISYHSATKYLGGHGDLVGGVIVCAVPEMAQAIQKTCEMYGSAMNPFNAWLAARGTKTLVLRLQRQCANAETLAHFLASHPQVRRVYYPGLSSHLQHLLARRLLNGFGAMLSFEVEGGLAAGKKVLNAVQVCHFTVSLGEIDTLIIHPASTSHIGLSPAERDAIGVTDGLLRLSVGIEDIDDLLGDLQQALDQL